MGQYDYPKTTFKPSPVLDKLASLPLPSSLHVLRYQRLGLSWKRALTRWAPSAAAWGVFGFAALVWAYEPTELWIHLPIVGKRHDQFIKKPKPGMYKLSLLLL